MSTDVWRVAVDQVFPLHLRDRFQILLMFECVIALAYYVRDNFYLVADLGDKRLGKSVWLSAKTPSI